MRGVYYNEVDPYAAQWLRNLIAAGDLPAGDVDERSIVDVGASDLAGYTSCHFFAGIGGWPHAARIAGWPDDRPIWTGSCPCQPWSEAGRKGGTDDARHLWPDFFRLIRDCRPAVVFGEQVSAAAGKRTLIDEAVQQMWRAEAYFGVLPHQGQARQFDWLARLMPDLLQEDASRLSEWFEGASVGFIQEVSAGEPSAHLVERREVSGEASRDSLRFGSVDGPDSGPHRLGSVRVVGDVFPAGWRSHMGQPLYRPDRAETWIRDWEHSYRALCPERDDEHLGCRSGLGNRGSDSGSAEATGSTSASAVGVAAEGAPKLDWLDGVCADLDTIDYACRAVDIPACAVDAPHERNRLYWVAVGHAPGAGQQGFADTGRLAGYPAGRPDAERADGRDGRSGDVVDAQGFGWDQGQSGAGVLGRRPAAPGADARFLGRLADADGLRELEQVGDFGEGRGWLGDQDGRRPNGSWWADHQWITCHDGKSRRAHPGISLLAPRLPPGMAFGSAEAPYHPSQERVAKWRGFGNAINAQLAKEVIAAFLDAEGGL